MFVDRDGIWSELSHTEICSLGTDPLFTKWLWSRHVVLVASQWELFYLLQYPAVPSRSRLWPKVKRQLHFFTFKVLIHSWKLKAESRNTDKDRERERETDRWKQVWREGIAQSNQQEDISIQEDNHYFKNFLNKPSTLKSCHATMKTRMPKYSIVIFAGGHW